MEPISESQIACVKCGYNLTGSAIGGVCPECGESVGASLPSSGGRKTSGLALASMITGICGISMSLGCGCAAIPLPIAAVILGHMARKQIAERPHQVDGGSMAVAGLIMGYISLALAGVMIVILAIAYGAEFL